MSGFCEIQNKPTSISLQCFYEHRNSHKNYTEILDDHTQDEGRQHSGSYIIHEIYFRWHPDQHGCDHDQSACNAVRVMEAEEEYGQRG